MAFCAAYAPPFLASIVPVGLNLAIAASEVYPVAGPFDSPMTTLLISAASGTALNVTVKIPVCTANGTFCHVAPDSRHAVGSGVTVAVFTGVLVFVGVTVGVPAALTNCPLEFFAVLCRPNPFSAITEK